MQEKKIGTEACWLKKCKYWHFLDCAKILRFCNIFGGFPPNILLKIFDTQDDKKIIELVFV